ncbi:MAG: alcohol dehydrogenase [Opitutae bacterium]|nr:alcohol dehydrogenase [Opitutae bacterium]
MSAPDLIESEAFVRLAEHPDIRVLFGPSTIHSLGEEASKLGSKVLLVTDAGIVKAGHAATAQSSLEASGLQVTIFDQSIENPTSACVDACVLVAKDAQVDVIVGLGGGSSMDTAKGCNFVLTNGGSMKDYWGIGKANNPMLPLIAVPTTAGTGSECQSFALISDDKTHRKMACGDKKALPKVAILDPELTVSQPLQVTACTGIDALAHALEAAVTRDRNPVSDRHARTAFFLVQNNLKKLFSSPEDLSARGFVLLGASHAGAAIESSMLGCAHSMANPLTARRGVAHGAAVGICLPAVMRFNAKLSPIAAIYAGLSRDAGLSRPEDADGAATEDIIAHVEGLLKLAGFPLTLQEHGFAEDELPSLATEAVEQWTAGFNPREVTLSGVEKLYASLYAGSACEDEGVEACS